MSLSPQRLYEQRRSASPVPGSRIYPRPPVPKDEVIARLRAGDRQAGLAREYGVTRSYINQLARRAGLPLVYSHHWKALPR